MTAAAADAVVTIRRAAGLAGCDPSTIKRDLLDGRYPGAFRDVADRNRAWLIPVRDLIVTGRYRLPVDVADAEATAAHLQELTGLRNQLRLEQEAHREIAARLVAAEASLAAEQRHSQTLERLVDRALSTGPAVA